MVVDVIFSVIKVTNEIWQLILNRNIFAYIFDIRTNGIQRHFDIWKQRCLGYAFSNLEETRNFVSELKWKAWTAFSFSHVIYVCV